MNEFVSMPSRRCLFWWTVVLLALSIGLSYLGGASVGWDDRLFVSAVLYFLLTKGFNWYLNERFIRWMLITVPDRRREIEGYDFGRFKGWGAVLSWQSIAPILQGAPEAAVDRAFRVQRNLELYAWVWFIISVVLFVIGGILASL